MTPLDVLVPVGARADNLAESHRARRRVLEEAGYDPLFIYVLDGDVAGARSELARLDPERDGLRVIQLSRCFGETAAILAGFSSCTAERVLILPPFEQVEVASLGAVLEALDGADLVTVRRYPRCDPKLKRVQSLMFESMVRLAGKSQFRDPGCTVHALHRSVLEETQLYGEQHGFLPVLADNVGFKVVEIDLPQAARDARRSLQKPASYLHRLVDIFSIFFLTRFTRRPLRFFGPIGAVCTLLGCIALAVVVVQRFASGLPLADRPALLLSSLLVALGLQIVAIGLIGELIVFINARSMKQYRIREIVEAGPAAAARPARLSKVGPGD